MGGTYTAEMLPGYLWLLKGILSLISSVDGQKRTLRMDESFEDDISRR